MPFGRELFATTHSPPKKRPPRASKSPEGRHQSAKLLSEKDSIYCFTSFSISAITCGESGVTSGSNRATTFPFRSTKNFVKFHLMSPVTAGFASLVRYAYKGVWSAPSTETFPYIGKVTLYFDWQKVLISAFVPGSCEPKLLAGKPRITNPLSLYFSYVDSSAVYCGVNPQRLATFTSSTTFPL